MSLTYRQMLVWLMIILTKAQSKSTSLIECEDFQDLFPDYKCVADPINRFPGIPKSFIVSPKDSEEELLMVVMVNDSSKQIVLKNMKVTLKYQNLKLIFHNENDKNIIDIFKFEFKNLNSYFKENVFNKELLGETINLVYSVVNEVTTSKNWLMMKDINLANIFIDVKHPSLSHFMFYSQEYGAKNVNTQRELLFAVGLAMYELILGIRVVIPGANSISQYDLKQPLFFRRGIYRDYFEAIRLCLHPSDDPVDLDNVLEQVQKIRKTPSIDYFEFDMEYYPETNKLVQVGSNFRWADVVNLLLFAIVCSGIALGIYFTLNRKKKATESEDQPESQDSVKTGGENSPAKSLLLF